MQDNNPYQAPGANVYDVAAEGADETGPFSPSGRFGRLSFIAWMTLVYVLFYIVSIFIAGGVTALQELAMAGGLLMLVLLVAFIAIFVLFSIRRLHDVNGSGWWSILMVVPIVNFFTGLVLMILPGTEGANNYGPPRITRTWEKVVGIIGIVLTVIGLLGIVAAIAIPMFAA